MEIENESQEKTPGGSSSTGRYFIIFSTLKRKRYVKKYLEISIEKRIMILYQLINKYYTNIFSSIHSRKTFIDSLTPKCVYSSHNTDGAGVIVFKNSCSDASFENCSDPNGMSLAQVLTVVRAMAKFHAAGRAFLARNRTQVTEK